MKRFNFLYLVLFVILVPSISLSINKAYIEHKLSDINRNIRISRQNYTTIKTRYKSLLRQKKSIEHTISILTNKIKRNNREINHITVKINYLIHLIGATNKQLTNEYNRLLHELKKYYKYSKISSYYAEGIWYQYMNKVFSLYIEKNINTYINKNKFLKMQLSQLKRYKNKRNSVVKTIHLQKVLIQKKKINLLYLASALNAEKVKYMHKIESLQTERIKLKGILKHIVEEAKRKAEKREKEKLLVLKEKKFRMLIHKLLPPIDGVVMDTFGQKYNKELNIYTRNDGIDIEGKKNECVHVVFKGKIDYIGNLPGYGNVIIVNNLNNYYTVYGNVKTNLRVGDFVQTYSCIGKLEGALLHFEIRHFYKAVNPLEFLNRRYLK